MTGRTIAKPAQQRWRFGLGFTGFHYKMKVWIALGFGRLGINITLQTLAAADAGVAA